MARIKIYDKNTQSWVYADKAFCVGGVETTTKQSTGGIVSVTPVANTPVKVVSKITSWDTGFTSAKFLSLKHIRSKNLFDFAGFLGGSGAILETNGLTGVVNDNGTITVTGTNTVDYNTAFSTALSPSSNHVGVFPAGTYTVSPGLSLELKAPKTDWSAIGANVTGTFTVDEPFWIRRFWMLYTGAGTAINETRPLYMVAGSAALSSEYAYDGNYYEVRLTNAISDGEFNWQTGELRDSDGNLVETVASPIANGITAHDGTNTFISNTGETVITYTSNAADNNLSEGSASAKNTFDPSAYGLPVLHLTGVTTGMNKDDAVVLKIAFKGIDAWAKIKWQGSSSLAYDKKNYTMTIYADEACTQPLYVEIVEGWGAHHKYCLKANFIDHSHARNIVSAKLWGQIVASRSPVNTTLKACPNYGAVDGFPIAIMLNGEFHGLYTWNIPKDKWMFNMGSGTQEAVICANFNVPAVDLRVHAKVDGSDHELEEVTDEDNAGWVATSLNNVIDLCVNSYGADLDSTIAQYLDWESAMDYYILTVLIDGRDMVCKNYIMATWNGTKWVFSAYDMDSTYGLAPLAGDGFNTVNDGVSFAYFRQNRVMELIYRFKTNALKARYKQLRESVLSEANIMNMFENFGYAIPSQLLIEDTKAWPSIPGSSTSTIDQILRWLHLRLKIVDKWMDEIPEQETPIAPSARAGNVIASSVDSTGAVYNGTGYKQGYTIEIANDGTEFEVVKDGCCITGYIPVTKDNVIKVTTDHWNISPANSRIIFYDMDLKPMAFYTQHGYVSLFNGYTNATAIQWKGEQSVTYGTDGLTTLNVAYGANCTNLGYIRIRGVGNGANLCVIREGEAPGHAPDNGETSGYTNLIPTSIDTDGSVYNGTGYKVGHKLDQSGAVVASTTYASSTFVTGFMPCKVGDVIRTFQFKELIYASGNAISSNGIIIFYDANFNKLDHYNASGYSTKALIDQTNSSWEYDEATRVTTVNIAWKEGATGVAWFRMSGMFNEQGEANDPAASVITVNEVIA